MTDIQTIISNLQHDDPQVKLAAIDELGELKDALAIGPLQRIVEDGAELEEVRDHAVAAIGDIGGGQASEALCSILLSCPDSKMRAAAARVIDWLDEKSDAVVDALVIALGDQDDEVGCCAAQSLGFTGNSRAVKPLLSALDKAAPDVRGMAASALGHIGDKSAVPFLISTMESDSDEDVRAWSAWALGEISDTAAVNPLLKSLGDKNRRVRLETTAALRTINTEAAVQKLLPELSHPDPQMRLYAIQELGWLRDKQVFDTILKFLSDESEDIRCAAIHALGELQEHRAAEYLGLLIHDSSRRIRDEAVWSLNKIKDPEGEEALIFVSLNDPDLWIRHRAIGALGEMGTQKAVEALSQIAREPMEQTDSFHQPHLDSEARYSLKQILKRERGEAGSDNGG
jgi:HEAT repeat protein